MFRHPRFFVSLVLVALLSVALSGCGLKPGSNDSSSAPPTVLNTPSTTSFSGNGPNVLFKTANVTFSHDAHVTNFKQACTECHMRGGVSNFPWPMAYKDVAYTMASMYTKNASGSYSGCGVCHNASGTAFDCGTKDSCIRCHGDAHSEVNTSVIGAEACQACHAQIVSEYQAGNGTGTHARLFLDPTGSHAPSAANQYSCSECHVHEAVFGKSSSLSMPTNTQHAITCQTCHYPTKADGGTNFPKRLRKDPEQLCATCHHMRYTYGDNPPSSTSRTSGGFTWPVQPMDDAGFPKLLTPVTTVSGIASRTNPTPTPLEIKYWGANTQAIMQSIGGQASAGWAIANLVYRGQLGMSSGKVTGGNYPHDSTQYDIFRGKTSGTLVEFSRDLKGATLNYNDSRPYLINNACIKCHVKVDAANGKFGHTFVATEESCKEVYGAGFSAATVEEEVKAKLHTLGDMLDADNDGVVNWTRSGVDADLRKVLNDSTINSATKLIMLGVAWNYFAIEGDFSEGVHNPDYVKSILDNCTTLMNQLKDPTVGSDAAKLTWY